VIDATASGQLTVAGMTCGSGHQRVEVATRMSSTGALDLAYGSDGWAYPLPPERDGVPLWRLGIAPDGTVLFGEADSDAPGDPFVVSGLRPSGAPDGRFGPRGTLRVTLPNSPTHAWNRLAGVSVDGQGRILLSGTMWDEVDGERSTRAVIVRLTADG
jgi:hypothetical protein